MTDDKRLELARRFERASFASGVGVSLGVWAGRGDWASMSESARNNSGHRALTELDQLLAQLTDFRQELAAAVQPGDTGVGAVPAVTRYTVSCIPEDISPADHDLWSVTVEYAGAQRWAVRRLGECLGTDGQWVYEPRSSELAGRPPIRPCDRPPAGRGGGAPRRGQRHDRCAGARPAHAGQVH